jgi:hypothetical protein
MEELNADIIDKIMPTISKTFRKREAFPENI